MSTEVEAKPAVVEDEEKSTTSTGSKKGKRRSIFRRKSSENVASSTAVGADGGESVVRRTKSFKRIRGLLSGESRKQRRESRAKSKAAKMAEGDKAPDSPNTTATAQEVTPAPSGEEDDGASTVYNVDVDDRSLATRSVSASTAKSESDAFFNSSDVVKKSMLKVVLLLMDPETRRFELLQLEFDSKKALVSDVMKQIPLSVTEDSLRKQEYMGICGKEGKLMEQTKLLSDFCHGNDVLVAIPRNMSAKECARLARPILNDEKVVSMLLSSGIDAKAWRETKDKKKKSSRSVDEEAKSSSSIGSWILGSIVIAILFQVCHIYLSAAIKPGHAVQPGVWLRKCGILSFFPNTEYCENAKLVFEENGLVTVFDEMDEKVWQIQGASCGEIEGCKPELRFNDDLSITVAGKAVSMAKIFKPDAALAPWPFADTPKLRLKK